MAEKCRFQGIISTRSRKRVLILHSRSISSRESCILNLCHRYNPEYHFLSARFSICAQILTNPASRIAIKSRIPLTFSESHTVFWSCSGATQQIRLQTLQSVLSARRLWWRDWKQKETIVIVMRRRGAATVKKSLTFFFHQKYSKILALPNASLRQRQIFLDLSARVNCFK